MSKKQSYYTKTKEEITNTKSCRVCLKNCKGMLSLLDRHNNAFVFQHINWITGLNIIEGDKFPDKICRDCLAELDVCIRFKIKCEKSNQYLYERINDNDTIVPIDNSQIKKEDSEYDNDVNFSDNSYEKLAFEEKLPNIFEKDLKYEYTEESIDEESIDKLGSLPIITGPVKCNECNELFKSKCKLRVHWKNIHLPESLTCQKCKRIFKAIEPFKKHITSICLNTKYIRVEGVGRNRIFCCRTCDYTTEKLPLIKQHIPIHSGEKKYVCDLCPKAYNQSSSLYEHKETVHQKQYKITCQYCGKEVQGRSKVYRHLQRHRKNEFQCDICKAFLKSKFTLRMHLNIHSGVRPYTCDTCGKSVHSAAHLANHKKSHSEVKLWHECDVCGYKTTRKDQFLRHRPRHNPGNVACSKCGKFFYSDEKLKSHIKFVHFTAKTIGCPLCNKGFASGLSCSKHVYKVHKTNIPRKSFLKLETDSPCVPDAIEQELFK